MKRSTNITSHDSPNTPIGPDQHVVILVAEDSSDNRFLIQSYLKHPGYQLDMAETGKVAFEMSKLGNMI